MMILVAKSGGWAWASLQREVSTYVKPITVSLNINTMDVLIEYLYTNCTCILGQHLHL